MYPFRTRFKKEIVTEFLPPIRPSQKVVILCPGMPSASDKGSLIEFFSKKGFWTFLPRYRGTWESDGSFLKISPEQDVLDIINELPRGFKEFYKNLRFKVKPEKIYVFGISFGGPAALLSSLDKRVTKVVALSPVIDWRKESRSEPMDWLGRFTRSAFGNGYRFSDKDWRKLKNGKFYNPIAYAPKMLGRKIFIIQAKDDKIISPQPALKFAKQTGCKLWLLRKGGHLSLNYFRKPRFYKQIKKFLSD